MGVLGKLTVLGTTLLFVVLIANFAVLDFSRVKGEAVSVNRETIAKLIINVDGQKITSDLPSQVGKTALEVTRQVAGGLLETKGEGTSAYVVAINGRRADSGKREFWELLVNGQPSAVGAGSYLIKAGDVIEWKIGTY